MDKLKDLLYHDLERPDFLSWDKTKRRWAKILKSMPANSAILAAYNQLVTENKCQLRPDIERTLKVRKVRTMSGVAPFAVMMKPFTCPGNCIYCATEPGMPKSYMSDEPAASRAKKANFDPAIQVKQRLEQMEATGHKPEKLQIIVIGGTFGAYPTDYRRKFIKTIFDACNGEVSESIERAQIKNETAKYRIIGLSVETRPDWVTPEEIKLMREWGVTKVQLGVQALDNKILLAISRGHNVDAIVKATQLLRDHGFKINYHIMPNLPTSTPQKDVDMGKQLFADDRFRPDTLKIYPCIVLPGTRLYDLWKSGAYESYDDETLLTTLIGIKQAVPTYCRIDRLVRDITKKWTVSGTLKTNMRELVLDTMKKDGVVCRCIRCREVRDNSLKPSNVTIADLSYKANDGIEHFLSFEDQNYLYAMLRLRFPPKYDGVFTVLKNAALIRELQVFGEQVGIDKKNKNASQHQSLGKQLLKRAEEMAKAAGYQKIAVISGVGVRGYYRKLGYKLEASYMVKEV